MLKTAELRGWFGQRETLPPLLRAPRVVEALRLIAGLIAALLVFAVVLRL